MPRFAFTVLGLALAGCAADSNYTLQLIPQVPNNQEPFADGPRVRVRLRESDGNTSWTTLGQLASGTVEGGDFGPLDDTMVGIALGGGGSGEVPLADLFAWGESPPLTAAADKEELEVPVLVARMDGFGGLGDLERPAYGAAAAVTRDGSAFLFGGVFQLGGACDTTILRLGDLNSGDWAFEPLDAVLPVGVCHAVATVVEIDGAELIVVSGGETSWGKYDQRSRSVSIFDPASGEVIWSGDGNLTRARHAARALSDGKVLLVGANQLGPTPPNKATWEIFDVRGQKFLSFGETGIEPWGFMAAPTEGGLALCGGGRWQGLQMKPTTTCERIAADGSSAPLPELPAPLRDGAMVTLSDGRLLITGGITVEGNAGDNQPAVSSAYILDPDADSAWKTLGQLDAPRAYHAMVADGRGGAVIVGGAGNAWGFSGLPPADVPTCGQRFVPVDSGGGFIPLESCGLSGVGMVPTVADAGGGMVLMLQGRVSEGDGATAYGVVARGPL